MNFNILSQFKKRQATKVGLDIGDAFVKVVQLIDRSSGLSGESRYELTGFGVGKIEGADNEAKLAAIKQAARDAGVSTNKVNTAVSGQSVIVRYISLPSMSKSELERAARLSSDLL